MIVYLDDEEDDEEEYDPVPSELTESKMMLVYQSNEMQRLYRQYAPTLPLLHTEQPNVPYLYSFWLFRLTPTIKLPLLLCAKRKLRK